MKKLRNTIAFVIAALTVMLTSCDVHEFPEQGEGTDVELVLDFTGNMNMDFYKYVDYLSRDVDGLSYDISLCRQCLSRGR